MADQYEDLQQSYGRCLRDKRFIERFYEVFMASHPAIAPMFVNTDFGAQRMALRRGISVAILHAAGSGLSRRTTEQMADVHAAHGRAPVDPALYPYWIDSLLAVIAETDDEATPALLARWRTAMGVVCATFTERYPGH
jgi:hemoglobin-like flavoprotein